MRLGYLTAAGLLLFSGISAQAQPASLGTPIPVAQLGKPQPAATRARGQAADTPVLGVPEPYPHGVYHPYSPPYPGSNYQPYAQGTLTSQSLPHPNYDYAPPPPPVSRGEAVRRTSFSSRSASESRFGGSVRDYFTDACDRCKDSWSDGRTLFQSDHSMDIFASPVTNPFLFEDPRSLTEIRPIFIYQTIPGSNAAFDGGNAYFYGTQARLALTDRWSVTLNKLGGVTINPGDNSAIEGGSGLAELHIGPKFTFLRNCEWGTAAAVGGIFQIPVGPSNVFQDTGDFSIVPYVSVAQNFGRSSYGTFNFMDTFGYSFRIGDDRSDFLYNSAHLDYDVANLHKIYPFLELNWFHYTNSGNARAINQEGRDFANIGGTDIDGRDYITLAPGLRYKFTECVQVGFAAEFPLTNPRDIQEFRMLVDLIFRY